uniref:Cytochrome c oxidase subunit 2 n=1 Tax=Syrbatus sp. 2 RRMO-2024a TaxID=3154168 RepID=A0AAU7LKN2_9COLE
MMTWNLFSTQNSACSLMEQLIFFHNYSIFMLLMIILMIIYFIFFLLKNKLIFRLFLNFQLLEFIWSILPMIILILMAFPSLNLLYLMDEMNSPMISIKIIGYQWYWSYEYSDFKNIEFNSYMKHQYKNYEFRFLEVDTRMLIPFNIQTRLIISSNDVLHSWTIPSLNIKMDAIPGRLNQINLNLNQTGLFFGQCSEICGINHSFMPIIMECISINFFLIWLNEM